VTWLFDYPSSLVFNMMKTKVVGDSFIRRIQYPDCFANATAPAQSPPAAMPSELELPSTVATVYGTTGVAAGAPVQAIISTAIGGGVVAAIACCGAVIRANPMTPANDRANNTARFI
jgi:hypothetical protein